MCHNGGSDIERKSAVAWLDENWRVIEETEIDGHNCHDIALDPDGSVWHSASKEGAILSGDGRRIEVADERMTRGLAVSESHIAIGLVILAPRDQRRSKGGGSGDPRPIERRARFGQASVIANRHRGIITG